MINNNYINFYNIFFLYYADLRLIDIKFEDFDKIFSDDLSKINVNFNNYINIKINNNFFCVDLLDNSNEEINYLVRFFNIYSLNSILLDLKNREWSFYRELEKFFWLLKDLESETWEDLYEKTLLYKENSPFLYNWFNSILKTFRWKKDLKSSLLFINSLINTTNLSIFYLFRIRNLFLYYYQTIVWREKFNNLLISNKSELLESKYMTIILSDLEKAKKINPNNSVIYLFEWFILLHFNDKRWVTILNSLRWKINDLDYVEHVDNFIVKYYILNWFYKEAFYILDNNKIEKNFKYYRNYFSLLILNNDTIRFINFIKNTPFYIVKFYSNWDIYNNDFIDFKEFNKDNNNINLPLNIDTKYFLDIVNSNNDVYSILLKLFTYINKDVNNYYLKDNNNSILLIKK